MPGGFNTAYGALLAVQSGKSLEELQKELKKLQNDQSKWNRLLGVGGSGGAPYALPENTGGYTSLWSGSSFAGNTGSGGNIGNTGGYASFKSSSITKRIFEPGIDCESKGLSDYKEELRKVFNSQKQSACEATMEEQTQYLADFIEATLEAIRIKEQEAAGGGNSTYGGRFGF